MAFHDLTGQRFNKLVAVEFDGWRVYPSGRRDPMWRFQCDCGNTTSALACNVKSGHTQSCGCYLNQRRIESRTIHGGNKNGKKEPLYIVWSLMKQRCNDANCPSYKYYGGRGIKVLWESYERFRSDMETSYRTGLEIDRKDNDGHYCKDNCKWSTHVEQSRNRRSNVVLELDGRKQIMKLWAEEVGLKPATLQARLAHGWSVEDAIRTPVL